VRKNGQLKAATWKEALDYVASKLKPLAGQNGSGVAALASTRLPVEALHRFDQLFAKNLGSDMATSIEEGVTTAIPGLVAQQGGKSFEGTLETLKESDCVVAIGVDLVKNHQVAGFFVKRALPHGTKLVVIDPFDNGLHDLADYSLRPAKGTDYDLIMGLAAGIVELQLAQADEVDLPELAKYTPEKVRKSTGIDLDTILAVAKLIMAAKKPTFVYGKGLTRNESGAPLKALLKLAQLAGALDENHSNLISLKGEANSLAAYQFGLDKPFQVNGHQAVYLALGDDHVSSRLVERLKEAPFVAVQASYVSPVTELADVVLPSEMWAEQEGHYLNLDGRLQEVHRGLTPPEDVRSHVEILEAIAAQLDFSLGEDWQNLLKQRISMSPILA
jgi:predicted molibdopterin-dependent oxidoreductase YjgC